MAGLDPATHVFKEPQRRKNVDPRLKAGDDEVPRRRR